jgi:hypothetical protein
MKENKDILQEILQKIEILANKYNYDCYKIKKGTSSKTVLVFQRRKGNAGRLLYFTTSGLYGINFGIALAKSKTPFVSKVPPFNLRFQPPVVKLKSTDFLKVLNILMTDYKK